MISSLQRATGKRVSLSEATKCKISIKSNSKSKESAKVKKFKSEILYEYLLSGYRPKKLNYFLVRQKFYKSSRTF